jgi:hypothetical protein
MPCTLMGAAPGQPLTPEQVARFAKAVGITIERAQDLADRCEK